MTRKKLLFILGTRPEALKLAPVILKAKQSSHFATAVGLTSQHRKMASEVLRLYKIKPDFNLSVMRHNQSLEDLSARLLPKISWMLKKASPDLVIVQGDTTTAFIAALASFYLKIPIAHVEAGLRSFDKHHPFPEESNRLLISHLADLHLAPTRAAAANLKKEGIHKNIFITGNTIVDALPLLNQRYLKTPRRFSRKMILVTAHRRENFGKPLRSICKALKLIVERHPDFHIVFPVHLNPKVQKVVHSQLTGIRQIKLLPPLRYDRFLSYMRDAYLILTDSGGIQEEAPSFKKPVLVMREVTERTEGLRARVTKLVGTKTDTIVKNVSRLLSDPPSYRRMIARHNPYGDGHASDRILKIFSQFLNHHP